MDWKDVSEQPAEVADLERVARIEVANPNPEIVYTDVLGSIPYKFPPFKKFAYKPAVADQLTVRAAGRWNDQIAQQKHERQYAAKCSISADPSMKDLTWEFVQQSDDGGLGPTITQPTMYPGLVRLDTPNGREMYENGLKWADTADEKKKEEYREKYKKLLYDPKTYRKEVRTGEAPPPAELDKLDKDATLGMVDLDVPSRTWDMKQLQGYIERLAGDAVNPEYVKDKKWLLKRAIKEFKRAQEGFNRSGVKYRLVE